MRITVVGPGAVGLLWASRLAGAGAEVCVFDYRPGRAARLQEQGVVLEDDGDRQTHQLVVSASTGVLAETDLALVCVKACRTKAVAKVLAQHLAAKGRALTLQNGLGNVEALVEALGEARVLGGITSEGATLLGEGRVRHAGQGQTHVGPADGPVDDFTSQVVELFNRAGFAAKTAEGVQNLIWTKLVINVGINALTAILDVPNGRLLELPAAQDLMHRAVAEALAVGRALGIEFLHQDMQEAVRNVAAATAQNISSMLQDVRAGRPTEVDYINTAVEKKALELGMEAPVNASLAGLVKAMEQGYT